jgi:hypothetical protein
VFVYMHPEWKLVTILRALAYLSSPFGNLARNSGGPHNPRMDLAQVFVGFLQPVAFGSIAVFTLFGLVHLRTPHRTPALAEQRPDR